MAHAKTAPCDTRRYLRLDAKLPALPARRRLDREEFIHLYIGSANLCVCGDSSIIHRRTNRNVAKDGACGSPPGWLTRLRHADAAGHLWNPWRRSGASSLGRNRLEGEPDSHPTIQKRAGIAP